MAITYGANAFTSNKGSEASTVCTWSIPPTVDTTQIIIVGISADNAGTAGVSAISNVQDDLGNVFSLVERQNRTAGGAANDGLTVELWAAPVTVAGTLNSVTVSFSPNVVAKCIEAWVINGATVTGVQHGGNTGSGTTYDGLTTPSVTSGELIFSVVGNESNSLPVLDSDTTGGAWLSAGGQFSGGTGGDGTKMAQRPQRKIVNATGTQQCNGSTGASTDWAVAWAIFAVAAAGATGTVQTVTPTVAMQTVVMPNKLAPVTPATPTVTGNQVGGGITVRPYPLAITGWTPLSLPSLAAWYDPSDLATITESGGLVSALADKSGHGFHLTQPTSGSRPITGTRSQLGRNVLDFDGIDDYMTISGVASHGGNVGLWGGVFLRDDATLYDRLTFSFAPTVGLDWNTTTGMVPYAGNAGANGAPQYNGVLGPTKPVLVGKAYVVVVQRDGDSLNVWQNYEPVSSRTGLGTANFDITRWYLGGPGDGDDWTNGWMAEQVWAETASATDAATLLEYLTNKWLGNSVDLGVTRSALGGGVTQALATATPTATRNQLVGGAGGAPTVLTPIVTNNNLLHPASEAVDTVTPIVTRNQLVANVGGTLGTLTPSAVLQQLLHPAAEALDVVTPTTVLNTLGANLGGTLLTATPLAVMQQLLGPASEALDTVIATATLNVLTVNLGGTLATLTPAAFIEQLIGSAGGTNATGTVDPVIVSALAQTLTANLGGALGTVVATALAQTLGANLGGALGTLTPTVVTQALGGGVALALTTVTPTVVAQILTANLGGALVIVVATASMQQLLHPAIELLDIVTPTATTNALTANLGGALGTLTPAVSPQQLLHPATELLDNVAALTTLNQLTANLAGTPTIIVVTASLQQLNVSAAGTLTTVPVIVTMNFPIAGGSATVAVTTDVATALAQVLGGGISATPTVQVASVTPQQLSAALGGLLTPVAAVALTQPPAVAVGGAVSTSTVTVTPNAESVSVTGLLSTQLVQVVSSLLSGASDATAVVVSSLVEAFAQQVGAGSSNPLTVDSVVALAQQLAGATDATPSVIPTTPAVIAQLLGGGIAHQLVTDAFAITVEPLTATGLSAGVPETIVVVTTSAALDASTAGTLSYFVAFVSTGEPVAVTFVHGDAVLIHGLLYDVTLIHGLLYDVTLRHRGLVDVQFAENICSSVLSPIR